MLPHDASQGRTPSRTAADDPLIGQTIDRYRIVDLLGVGAIGRVYRARHLVLHREYAVKVLAGDSIANEDISARFQREAEVLSELRHENLVSVVDFGTTPSGLSFLVMELVEGTTLARAIRHAGNFTLRHAATIARQLAAALAAVHERGYVHRDIKPSNIMVTEPEQGREVIKLLDFGIAGTKQHSVCPRLTHMRATLGTATYMAPEQALDPNVGPEADLYSLGVVLYEMLCGFAPFCDMRRKCTEKPARLPAAGGLEDLVDRLLEISPKDRIQSAEEVIAALDRMLPNLEDEALHDLPTLLDRPLPAKEIKTLAERPVAIRDLGIRHSSAVAAFSEPALASKSLTDDLPPFPTDEEDDSDDATGSKFAGVTEPATLILRPSPRTRVGGIRALAVAFFVAAAAAIPLPDPGEGPSSNDTSSAVDGPSERESVAYCPIGIDEEPVRAQQSSVDELEAKLRRILMRRRLLAGDLLFNPALEKSAERLIEARHSEDRPRIVAALEQLIRAVERTER
jgi:serine/threonine protein kinase